MQEPTTTQSSDGGRSAMSVAEDFLAGKVGPSDDISVVPETSIQDGEGMTKIEYDDQGNPTEVGEQQELALDPPQPPSTNPLPHSSAPVPPGARDYKAFGFTDDEQKWARDMGNNAFKNVAPAWKEYKEWKAGAEARAAKEQEQTDLIKQLESKQYYDLDDGHTLDPEIRPLDNDIRNLEGELAHWQQQLVNAEKGEPIVPIVLNAEGRPVKGEPMDPTPELKGQMNAAMLKAYSLLNDVRGKHSNLVQSFKSRQQDYFRGIEEIRTKTLAPYEKHIAPLRAKALEAFPLIRRNMPEVKAMADLMIMLQLQGKLIRGFQAKEKGSQANAAARIANPTPTTTAQPNGDGSPSPGEASKFIKDILAGRVNGVS